MECKYYMKQNDIGYHKGGTSLRVEVFSCSGRCGAMKKKTALHIDSQRWINSGGCVSTLYHICPRDGSDYETCKIYNADTSDNSSYETTQSKIASSKSAKADFS